MSFELNEILTIIDKVKNTGLNTFEYQDDDVKIKIRGQKTTIGGSKELMNGGFSVDNSIPMEETTTSYTIHSPMVGTFYRAPSEDGEPFVSVGDKIEKGQIIGIIEAMKLMNEIPADVSGIVEEILVDNEGVVEFGQPLIRVK